MPDLVIYLVRHAEAVRNLPKARQEAGVNLDELTPKGVQQAKDVAQDLAGRGVTLVLSSPRAPAVHTGKIIAETLKMDSALIEDAAFVPLKKGTTGYGRETSMAWRISNWQAHRDPRPINGESMLDGAKRAMNALIANYAALYPGQAIVVVTHREICASLIGYANGTSIYSCYALCEVPRGSVKKIDIYDQGKTWMLAP